MVSYLHLNKSTLPCLSSFSYLMSQASFLSSEADRRLRLCCEADEISCSSWNAWREPLRTAMTAATAKVPKATDRKTLLEFVYTFWYCFDLVRRLLLLKDLAGGWEANCIVISVIF